MRQLGLIVFTILAACGGCDDTANSKFVEPDAHTDAGNDAAPNSATPDADTTMDVGDAGPTDASPTDADASSTPAAALDLLLVIDNSGSACGVQSALRNGFRAFLGPLTDAEVDVRIALTTTHMRADYPLEPVARPGHIQSTPQPVPGFDRFCHDRDGDYAPIREVLAAALACSSVDPADYDWSDADIVCAMYATPQGCAIDGVCGGGDPCTPEDLFPPADTYEDLPRVLEVERYRDDTGKLDFLQLERDFACMTLAGTRGYGIEKGLAAAVLATSPELVGGVLEAPTDAGAPNHGLLRAGADFGLVFVTEENDCSHDGSLDETTTCGGDVCAFANHPDATDSPLLDVADVKTDLVANLRAAKGADFAESRIHLGALLGTWNRYDGPIPTADECLQPGYEGPPDSCTTSRGRIFSGDRYDRFLAEFTDSSAFPERGEDTHLPGLLCDDDLEPHLRDLGTALAAGAR